MKAPNEKELGILAASVGLKVHKECGGYRLRIDGGHDVFPNNGICPVTTRRECLVFIKGLLEGSKLADKDGGIHCPKCNQYIQIIKKKRQKVAIDCRCYDCLQCYRYENWCRIKLCGIRNLKKPIKCKHFEDRCNKCEDGEYPCVYGIERENCGREIIVSEGGPPKGIQERSKA